MSAKQTVSEKKIDEILEFLRKCSIFNGLSLESLIKISEKTEECFVAKDVTIIENGSKGKHLYIIKSGSARVVKEGGTEEFTVTALQRGVCFGEMSLLTGEPCCAMVKTNEETILYFITKSNFDTIISENPSIYKHFIKLLAERITFQNKKNIELREHEIALSKYLQDTKEYRYGCVIGKSLAMKKTLEAADNLSKTYKPAIIAGEQGSGKGTIARNIHMNSVRSGHPVVEYLFPHERRSKDKTVTIERRRIDLIACELFGSEKTFFYEETGKRIGRFELADQGSLVLRNIENMPFSIQGRLLEFLNTGNFFKVGGDVPISVNIRIFATTNNILLAQEKLNPDLYHMLSQNVLKVPSLRDRKKEIPYLLEYFSGKISNEKHIPVKTFTKKCQ